MSVPGRGEEAPEAGVRYLECGCAWRGLLASGLFATDGVLQQWDETDA